MIKLMKQHQHELVSIVINNYLIIQFRSSVFKSSTHINNQFRDF